MDWMQWIPTPLRPSRAPCAAVAVKPAEERQAQRRKQVQRRRRQPVAEDPVGRPLIFRTSEDACLCQASGATLASPVLLGLGDSSSGVGHFPSELLQSCQKIAEMQLLQPNGQPAVPEDWQPSGAPGVQESYLGPIALLKGGYEATASFGSSSVALAAIDNSSVIHGQLHPMVAMLSLGGCELLQLRRRDFDKNSMPISSQASAPPSPAKVVASPKTHQGCEDTGSPVLPESTNVSTPENTPEVVEPAPVMAGELEIVFRAPAQTSHGLTKGDAIFATRRPESIVSRDILDTEEDMSHMLEAIEAKSSVQCASARQGDIIILTSAGLLSGSTLEDCAALCNEMLPPTPGLDFSPTPPELLRKLAQRISTEAACVSPSGFTTRLSSTDEAPPDVAMDRLWDEAALFSVRLTEEQLTPSSVVVAEVVEWLDDSGSSSSATVTPEKVDMPSALHRSLSIPEDRRMDWNVKPVLEGLEAMQTVNCSLGFNDYTRSLCGNMAKVESKDRPLMRSLTNDNILDLGPLDDPMGSPLKAPRGAVEPPWDPLGPNMG